MQLFITQDGRFIAQTVYGEWQAKQAGFTWNKALKYWETTDKARAQTLAQTMGQTYQTGVPAPAAPAPSQRFWNAGHSQTPQTPQGDKWPKIGEGRYAVVDPKDGVLKFYVVDKPKEGKWAGWTFLKVLASDTKWPIKDQETKQRILDEINKSPFQAMCKYGQMVGSCGHCGKTLTDEVSRKLGIGPVCRGKLVAA